MQRCALSTLELSQLARGDALEPCIIYDEMPTYQDVAVVTMVQVTPAECSHHRDGAYVAVRKMNSDNNGKGITIGFYGDHSVRGSMRCPLSTANGPNTTKPARYSLLTLRLYAFRRYNSD